MSTYRLPNILRGRMTAADKAELANACGWSPDSSNVRDRLSELS